MRRKKDCFKAAKFVCKVLHCKLGGADTVSSNRGAFISHINVVDSLEKINEKVEANSSESLEGNWKSHIQGQPVFFIAR